MRPARLLLLLLSALLLGAIPAKAESRAETERRFAEWLQHDLWPEARSADISPDTFTRFTEKARILWELPDLVPPGEVPRQQHQGEFGSPGAYFSEKRLQSLAATGKSLATRHEKVLTAVERQYGVPGAILLAIWGRESGYGAASIPHDAFHVLATKAFLSSRRDMFRRELIAALQMVETGRASPAQMRSSWAGALGQPQFLPGSYLAHAVDFDGDGRADIWNSVPDTLASIANYLRHHGWVTGRDWGFEVHLPGGISCSMEGPDRGRAIQGWAGLGIQRIGGRAFPPHEEAGEGYLLMPAGRLGPAFIVTPNFYVLKKYNESDLYALFIGHLADRIAYSVRPFSGKWQKIDRMLRSDIAAFQRMLELQGQDVGGADGLPGFRTRRSIGEFQMRNGLPQTCFPSSALVKSFRQ